ncbi:ribosomal-processing cysteine protease Prp [Eubacterium maltosivorans]|uniref:ribosomal-processing cysteine protease Prp n=1 Tax=Eubacterium maltosivorans TaxID=2041044 RepID=UPI001A9AE1B5|nr:ribosomal-processing cysteine protease Prp [Eubacterium maltosivorans]
MRSNEIEMSGHAGYDVPGKDIVCAAVSVLTETLIASVLTLSDSKIQVQKDEGYTKITYGPLVADFSLQVLLRAFFIGVSGVAEAYPDHANVQAVED